MMNQSKDFSVLVQKLNDEKATLLLPAVIYIAVLMLTGIAGNLMVLYYYAFKTKTSTTNIFIVILAVYDLIICTITMPYEIVDLVKIYTFENVAACKILTFINFVGSVGSVLTLITIAVNRYQQICKPTGNQMTVKNARRYCIIIIAVAILLSWPALVLFTPVKFPIPNKSEQDLKGSACTIVKESIYNPYIWAFNLSYIIIFLCCLTLLVVMYSIIGHKLHKHRRRLAKYKVSVSSTQNAENRQDPTQMFQNDKEPKERNDQQEKSEPTQLNHNTNTEERDRPAVHSVSSKSVQHTFDRETVKITLLMITITAVFFVSCLPYLCLTIWRAYEGKHEAEFLSDAGLVGFMIGQRSYLINSSLNPWIYGIFNSRFRQYYYKRLCCKC